MAQNPSADALSAKRLRSGVMWKPNQRVHFWDLPLEIRRTIYRYTFQQDGCLHFCIERRKVDDMWRANEQYRLPIVSKQMYDESIDLYYDRHDFIVYSDPHEGRYPSHAFVSPLAGKIRNLEIDYSDVVRIRSWPNLTVMKEVIIHRSIYPLKMEALLGLSSLNGSVDAIRQLHVMKHAPEQELLQRQMQLLVKAVPTDAIVVVSVLYQITFWTNPRHWDKCHAREKWDAALRTHLTGDELEVTGTLVSNSRCKRSEVPQSEVQPFLDINYRRVDPNSEELQWLSGPNER